MTEWDLEQICERTACDGQCRICPIFGRYWAESRGYDYHVNDEDEIDDEEDLDMKWNDFYKAIYSALVRNVEPNTDHEVKNIDDKWLRVGQDYSILVLDTDRLYDDTNVKKATGVWDGTAFDVQGQKVQDANSAFKKGGLFAVPYVVYI